MGNSPSAVVPYGGQASQINIPVDCTNDATGNVLTQNLTFSAFAPLTAGSYFLSDVQASLTIPGVGKIGHLTVDLAVSNAQPANLSISGTTYMSNVLYIRGQEAADLGPILSLNAGPINITGDVSRYSVSGARFDYTDDDFKLNSYTCTVPPKIVGSVVDDGVARAPSIEGVRNTLPNEGAPSAPLGSKATTANLPLVCSDYPYELQVTAISPVQPSELFQVTNFVFFFKIPAAQVERIKAAAGTDQVTIGILAESQGDNPAFGFNLTNASPAVFDLANNFTPTDPNQPHYIEATYKTTGGNLTLAFPLDGSLSLSPWQASSGIFSASPLGINGLIGGAAIVALEQFSCAVSPAVEIFAGPIP